MKSIFRTSVLCLLTSCFYQSASADAMNDLAEAMYRSENQLAPTQQAISSQAILSFLQISKQQPNQWHWSQFESLPRDYEYEKAKASPDINKKARYMVSRTIDSERNMSIDVYGTKQRPEVVVLSSAGYGFHEPESLWKLNEKDMKRLNSNCNFGKITITSHYKDKEVHWGTIEQTNWIDYQRILSYSTAKNHPLYIVSSSGGGSVVTATFSSGINTKYIFTPYKDKLPEYIKEFGWNTTKQKKKVKCTVS